MENWKKEKTCCFTGHTPKKLKGTEEYIRECLLLQVSQAMEDGYDTFITGMARGVDLWAAEVVLNVKKNNLKIKLIAAAPIPDFDKIWEKEWQDKYQEVLRQADEVVYANMTRNNKVFHIRDRWMVDNSSRVIGIFNGTYGQFYMPC